MRTAHKDILWPDAGWRTVHPAPRAESLGGHYAACDLANVRPAPPGAGFRRLGGSRAGLVPLGAAAEIDATWEWPGSSGAIEWTHPDSSAPPDVIQIPAAVRIIAAPHATLRVHERGPVAIAGDGAPSSAVCPCLWRGRHVAGDGAMVRFSAIGDFSDWSLLRCGQSPAAPCALVPAPAGRGADAAPVTAIVPWGDALLLAATADTLSLLTGDPASGSLALLSDRIGILSPSAWCSDGSAVWFLSREGLCRIVPGAGPPVQITASVLPDLWRGLDPAAWHFSLAWSAWERGVYVSATPRDATKRGVHAFIDPGGSGDSPPTVWPDEYASLQHEPVEMATAIFDTPTRHPRVALKGRDGAWRVHDAAASADDGATLASRILLGPIRAAGNAGESAFAAELETSFASQGSAVSLCISASDAPEALLSSSGGFGGLPPGRLAASPVRSSTFTLPATSSGPIRHPVLRPRLRGAWCTLRLSATAPWSLDTLRLTSRSTGRFRP